MFRITDGAGTTNYTFDDFGHMTTAGGVNYTYDGLDRITTRGTTPFTYSLLNNQPTSDGTTTIARTPDGSPLSVNQGATALNLIADRHGDIVATVTAAGALTDSIAYTPWGEQAARTGTTALTVGYQSSYTDPTTGLIDMGARWYQASTGTFTSRDTYNGELSNPISLNRYTYAQGDPMAYFDPDGHISADVAARQAAVKKRYRDPRSADRATRDAGVAAERQARIDRSRLTADHADRIITEYRRKATNYALQNAYQQRLAELRRGKSDINPQDDPILREIAHMVVQNNFSVFDTAKHGGDGDGSIGKVDFEAVKKNKNGQYDPLLAWAAGQLLANGKGSGDPSKDDFKLGDEGWKLYDIIRPQPLWKTAVSIVAGVVAGFACGAIPVVGAVAGGVCGGIASRLISSLLNGGSLGDAFSSALDPGAILFDGVMGVATLGIAKIAGAGFNATKTAAANWMTFGTNSVDDIAHGATTLGGVADDAVTVYRGTANVSELAIQGETGHLMSDAARAGYVESGGSMSAANAASAEAHAAGVGAWGSETTYAQAHGAFGGELSQIGPRSMVSVTTDPGIAKYFAGPNGQVFSAVVQRSTLIPQTLPGAGESEFLIRHMLKVL